MRRNAFFQIIQKKDGMYLKSYPEVEGGKKLTMEDILDYIDKKNLRDIETGNVKQFVEKANADETGSVEVKVLEGNHLPEKEFAIISTDKNGFYAKIRLYPYIVYTSSRVALV